MEFANQLVDKVGKEYLSYSSIKYALQDMRLWEMYMAGQLKKESQALYFGSVYDCLLFEPEKYEERFATFDDHEIVAEIGGAKPRTTLKYKKWKKDMETFADTNNLQLVSEEDFAMAIDMINRLDETGLKDSYLTGEVQVEFNSFIGEIPVRGFLDVKGDGFITDSKSCRSVKSFGRDIFSFGYDIQAYIYTSVFPGNDYYWVAQEKSYPYLPALVKATPETIERGKGKFELAINRIMSYLDSDVSTETFYAEFEV
jgi:hypothetical protein